MLRGATATNAPNIVQFLTFQPALALAKACRERTRAAFTDAPLAPALEALKMQQDADLSDDEKRLIVALRDLSQSTSQIGAPPDDDASLAKMGIVVQYADRFLRPWINETFREPKGLAPLAPSALKASTTYSKLKEHCAIKTPVNTP